VDRGRQQIDNRQTMADEDPESPVNLSQSDNLVFHISRTHALATRIDEVRPCSPWTV